MNYKINGSRYDYFVVNKESDKSDLFSIRATCRTTNTTSYINNLNPILSELGVDPTIRRFENSEWFVTKKQARGFIVCALDFLKDRKFLDYLEHQLDEDRLNGEWENFLIENKIL